MSDEIGKAKRKEIVKNIENLHKKLLLDFDKVIDKVNKHNKTVQK